MYKQYNNSIVQQSEQLRTTKDKASEKILKSPIPTALGRQRQVDLREFEASLVYRASFRTGSKATERNPVPQKTINQSINKRAQYQVQPIFCFTK